MNEKLKERHGEKSLPQKVIDTVAPAPRETGSREPDILTVYTGINSGKPIRLEESDKYVDFFEPGLFHPETEDMGDLDLDKKNLDIQKNGIDLSLKNLDLVELNLDLNGKDLDLDKKNVDISQEKNLDHSDRENSLEFPLFD